MKNMFLTVNIIVFLFAQQIEGWFGGLYIGIFS